ncbi:hypothetical protein [Microcoleus sp. S13C4]
MDVRDGRKREEGRGKKEEGRGKREEDSSTYFPYDQQESQFLP